MKIMKLSLIVLASFLLTSCFCIPIEIHENSRLWGEFIPKGEYELMRDVFLIRPYNKIYIYKDARGKVIKRSSDLLALTPENSFYQNAGYSAPNTIQEYEQNPEESVKKDYEYFISVIDVVGIVRKGTKIRCSLLEKDYCYSLWFGPQGILSYYAQIIDGPYSGSEVDVNDLGVTIYPIKSSDIISRPDPRLLKLIQK